MKFSVSTLAVVLPLLAAQASALAVPEGGLALRAGKGGQFGGAQFGGGKFGKGQQGKGAGKGAAAAKGAAAGAAGGAAVGAAAGAAAGGAANATAGAAGAGAAGAGAAGAGAAGAGAAGAANATAGAGATAGAADIQNSLTLDPSVLATGFEQNGQQVPAAGQVASLTSSNNFINFCATTKQTITNGAQVKGGSCNPAPMGQIPATTAMPSCKFTNPKNMQDIAANQAFTITMAIQNMETGNFVNAATNYFSAPQQLNAQGQIVGHSHVVVEQLSAIDQTTPNDPNKFAFFKGLNAAAQNGVLSADVTAGLPAGVYKLSSINTAANHQPALVPIAQHGSLDDAVYFTVGGAGAGAANATAAAGAATATAAAGAANATAAAGAAGGAAAGAAGGAAAGAAGGAAAGAVAGAAGKGAAAGAAGKGAAAAAAGKGAAAAAAGKGAAAAAGGKGAAPAAGGKSAAAGGKGKARRFIREAY